MRNFYQIILPIIRVAATVGGVGKGWRRPLHQFVMNNNNQPAARGCHLTFRHDYKGIKAPFVMPLRPEEWSGLYARWENSVKTQWPGRFALQNNVNAEVFSPRTCAVYSVAGPGTNLIEIARDNDENPQWTRNLDPPKTRGLGMDLIYQPDYKRKPDVGGNAAGGAGYCSWVTIKRMSTKNGHQEIVCIFGGTPKPLRKSFLGKLKGITGAVHLFGNF